VLEIMQRIVLNAWTLYPPDEKVIGEVLLRDGAKDNRLILSGQYWRFLAPVFLHVNALHLIINMANFVFLGLFLERLCGHTRFVGSIDNLRYTTSNNPGTLSFWNEIVTQKPPFCVNDLHIWRRTRGNTNGDPKLPGAGACCTGPGAGS
jgi:hypothetical protein